MTTGVEVIYGFWCLATESAKVILNVGIPVGPEAWSFRASQFLLDVVEYFGFGGESVVN